MSLITQRRCGVLLHISSLPKYDLCFDFIDLLKQSEQSYWQVLPLNPVMSEGSPYKCYSAFAGDTRYIGKIKADIKYSDFERENRYWLTDYALFVVLKEHFKSLPWNKWDKDIAFREGKAIDYYKSLYKRDIKEEKIKQFEFHASWKAVMDYAEKNNIQIIGDMPLYVAHDSADVWAKSQYFKLDEKGEPKKVSGVPPDYFSMEGQLWGNPVYDWESIKRDKYQWWLQRFRRLKSLTHILRIDHFRGLESYWEIDADETSAINGRWVKAPGEDMLKAAIKEGNTIIAEDLGIITADVIALKNRFSFPGMKVLQFDRDIYEQNLVVYTGTHDNDTMLGWYRELVADNYERAKNILALMSVNIRQKEENIVWDIIEYAYNSIANTVIVSMQDILCLGSEARMNVPGVAHGNWNWKFDLKDFNKDKIEKLKKLTFKYGRANNRKHFENKKADIKEVNYQELYQFKLGKNYNAYKTQGSHFCNIEGTEGILFTLWAPNAQNASVVGDFNGWNPNSNMMEKHKCEEFWIAFIPEIPYWNSYKYAVTDKDGKTVLKSDPFSFHAETRPKTSSKIVALDKYIWSKNEIEWEKQKCSPYDKPINIYEVHLGSWKRGENNRFLSYRELADLMPKYVSNMGYTHIEIMPVMEHPLDDSWGYQITGYYAPTSRYGTPEDFMYLVDKCHEQDLGVILDWVPGHFCKDEHGLYRFDGTNLYEYDDYKKAENNNWGTHYFDLGKAQVKSFLISNAMFWLDYYHVDGFRIDAVASMLYLDYEKDPGKWTPNKYGGRENIEAIEFFRQFNKAVYQRHPYALIVAEESTSWPLVTAPSYTGGLGFKYKWNMGWMNDMLEYMSLDAVDRKWHHKLITFSMMYAYSENFILPLSHDEVVHGKKSMIDKMWGDYWKKFASLRMFYAYMMAHPGKKLSFMGNEFAQFVEWNFNESLEWFMLDFEMHSLVHKYVRELNFFYKKEKALWEQDHKSEGFIWIDANNYSQSIISFIRKSKDASDLIIVVSNFTPVVYEDYSIGVPIKCDYIEVLNTDSDAYGGSNVINEGNISACEGQIHGNPYHIKIKIPPLATIYLKTMAEQQ
ncbi:MAG: 1,4-alpha-glucan branching protein GlgB [Firmicutes bacterium]|nr:1,4-alpha-glucan branching protein GlgB [Bacillota bacterium]